MVFLFPMIRVVILQFNLAITLSQLAIIFLSDVYTYALINSKTEAYDQFCILSVSGLTVQPLKNNF